jgi:lipopolysaccharide biosynthesis glycosyltransferase
MKRSIYIGYDERESEAFAVCRHSIARHSPDIPVHAIEIDDVRDAGLYYRPTSRKDGRLWDDISEAPMSTAFAISRFLTPILARDGWALFIDCDMMARTDINELFDMADKRYAVMCVKHPNYVPPETIKMDGQLQTLYRRKNWSSAVLYNCDHPSNRALTVNMVNAVPGRDLHAFNWLKDDEIGDLPMSWNWLAGVSDPEIVPDLIHWTAGGPWFEGYRDAPYADEWRCERACWLAGGFSLTRQPSLSNGQFHAIGA